MKEDRNWFKPWVARTDQQPAPPCNTNLPPSRAQKLELLNYYQDHPLDNATRRHGSASSHDGIRRYCVGRPPVPQRPLVRSSDHQRTRSCGKSKTKLYFLVFFESLKRGCL